MDKLLDRVDINNDGHVEFGELASALVDWRQVWQGRMGRGCLARMELFCAPEWPAIRF